MGLLPPSKKNPCDPHTGATDSNAHQAEIANMEKNELLYAQSRFGTRVDLGCVKSQRSRHLGSHPRQHCPRLAAGGSQIGVPGDRQMCLHIALELRLSTRRPDYHLDRFPSDQHRIRGWQFVSAMRKIDY